MSPEEAQLMMEHAVYWRGWLGKGNVIAFGFVADPASDFGVGLVEFDNADEAREFADGDPTVKSGRGFSFDILPMPMGIVTAKS
jgi:hypothetical protein